MLTKLVSWCRQANELISWKMNRFFEELHKIFFQSTTSWFVFKSLSFFSIKKRKLFFLSSNFCDRPGKNLITTSVESYMIKQIYKPKCKKLSKLEILHICKSQPWLNVSTWWIPALVQTSAGCTLKQKLN